MSRHRQKWVQTSLRYDPAACEALIRAVASFGAGPSS